MCCEQASTLTLSLIAEPKPPNTGRMTLNPNLPSQGTDVCDGWFHGEAAGVPGKEGGQMPDHVRGDVAMFYFSGVSQD